jgi:hypothetical protein
MEKVALLSGTVVCLFFVLGAISTKIENRRRSDTSSCADNIYIRRGGQSASRKCCAAGQQFMDGSGVPRFRKSGGTDCVGRQQI